MQRTVYPVEHAVSNRRICKDLRYDIQVQFSTRCILVDFSIVIYLDDAICRVYFVAFDLFMMENSVSKQCRP